MWTNDMGKVEYISKMQISTLKLITNNNMFGVPFKSPKLLLSQSNKRLSYFEPIV